MSVTKIGTMSRRSSYKNDGSATHTQVLKLHATANPDTDRESAVLATLGINRGTTYDDDAAAVCTSIDLGTETRRQGSTTFWEWTATCQFATRNNSQNEPSQSADPLGRPVEISVSNEAYRKAIAVDIDGNRLANAVGEPIPRDTEYARRIITLSRHYATWDARRNFDAKVSAQGYVNSRNADVFTINLPPFSNLSINQGRGLLKSIEPQPVYENGTQLAKVTFKIAEDLDNHADLILHVGFSHVDPNTGNIVPFVDRGVPAAQPRLLDVIGFPLNPATDDPWMLSFQYNPTRDWTVLAMLGGP